MRALILIVVGTGCGGVERDDGGDADSDSDCEAYCTAVADCGWLERAECDEHCACLLLSLRGDAAAPFLDCAAREAETPNEAGGACDEGSAAAVEAFCGETVAGVVLPVSLGADYDADCWCEDTGCDLHALFADDAVETLMTCLDEGTCEEVSSCETARIAAYCAAE